MRGRRRALTALAIVLGSYLALGLAVRLRAKLLPRPAAPTSLPPPRALQGAVHVHTDRSHDGRGSLAEVAAAAKESGLDFLVLADHNVEPAPAAYVDGVLIIPGAELSAPHGHLLSLGAWRGGEPTVARVHASRAWAVVAHPAQTKRGWTGWDAETEWDAVEIVSLDSLWRAALRSPLVLVPAALAYPWAPSRALATLWGREPEALARWDRELARRAVAGLCSVDAHGIPSYRAAFSLLTTYVLAEPTGQAAADAARVLDAIFAGRAWCALSALQPAPDFRFWSSSEGFDMVGGATAGAQAVLICDGEEVARALCTAALHFPPRPGACRVEVRAPLPGLLLGEREVTWIYSSAARIPGG